MLISAIEYQWFAESRDWHHAGRDGLLLCSDCRLFYKKYGQLRPVDRPSTVPPCLFKRSPSGTDADEDSGVRTRAGKKERRRFVTRLLALPDEFQSSVCKLVFKVSGSRTCIDAFSVILGSLLTQS